jgi:hypothetical protein
MYRGAEFGLSPAYQIKNREALNVLNRRDLSDNGMNSLSDMSGRLREWQSFMIMSTIKCKESIP